ncbi:xylosyltransferase 1-like [Mizuhopecten yessoensis]|uniref:xylosyltransferase 1-like n=1 Tax=Mizuhopecten yessoensis TaxID=6573 RepID=UPI000B45972B|nr:xylosyltransferase 1-like [Mizuhopecten yessoensis]
MARHICRRCFKYKKLSICAITIVFLQFAMFYMFSFDKDFRDGKIGNKNGKDPPDAVQLQHLFTQTLDTHFIDNNTINVPLSYKPKCLITGKEAMSAINRSKTPGCKQEIADVYCLSQEGKLYPTSLPNTCPYKGTYSKGHHLGCFRDNLQIRDLRFHTDFPEDNSPTKCTNFCLLLGYVYAGLQYSKECWCGNNYGTHKMEEEGRCVSSCPGSKEEKCGGYLANSIYSTGLREKILAEASLISDDTQMEMQDETVKIVFVFTVNGRAVRQVRRLIKAIYHRDHYYYIHVDKRQEFLFRELLPLEKQFSNIHLARTRFATIWGGASLLDAHLHFIEELLGMKDWKWDYYLNLSESDYPIKRLKTLELFLTKHKGHTFLKSHGRETMRFIQKQGLENTFLECENHLWRVAPRTLPSGFRLDGGSDWVTLHRDFCIYASQSKSELVSGLKQVFKYTLLPVESFFHTLIHNSPFCDKCIDNNLHMTNWRRRQGCKCQYKHIVDWCGCSPNDLKSTDFDRLLAYEHKPTFFSRKFEAIVNQEIINSLDIYLFGKTNEEMSDHYWQNEYHHFDVNTKKKDEHHSFYMSFLRRAAKDLELEAQCRIRPQKLLEVHLLYIRDRFNGVLTLYEALDENTGNIVTMETHVQWERNYAVIKPVGPIGRLISLEVGTDFDLKELIFRNYAQLLGPYSDLVLRHVWGQGMEFTVSVAWIDPANVIAASYEVTVPKSSIEYIGNHKPQLSVPLRPGVWTVKLMHHWTVLAETKFLVIPLIMMNGQPINPVESELSHGGPQEFYASKDFSEFRNVLKINASDAFINDALFNSKKTGAALESWIDLLTQKFWSIQSTCSVNAEHCPQIDLCDTTSWSSRSPDPKSEIRGIDERTGLLVS